METVLTPPSTPPFPSRAHAFPAPCQIHLECVRPLLEGLLDSLCRGKSSRLPPFLVALDSKAGFHEGRGRGEVRHWCVVYAFNRLVRD